ncbi:hypothetical protein AMTR_s00158p00060120 [Amborella trichopoda]|uniref:Uncharacterized protein n=1 Tax=Amborella trichopoda TaxID=13333 RepID=W1PUG5_AMBTC|nr:hypothetical protein AMTR_s00158p00060120 [Amborella trichopoda]
MTRGVARMGSGPSMLGRGLRALRTLGLGRNFVGRKCAPGIADIYHRHPCFSREKFREAEKYQKYSSALRFR